MIYTVSITSQGQISIPIGLRRKLGLDKSKRALVTEIEGKIVLEPVKDLLDLKGSLKTNLPPSPTKVRKAFEQYLAKRSV